MIFTFDPQERSILLKKLYAIAIFVIGVVFPLLMLGNPPIDKSEYAARRINLMAQIGDGIAIPHGKMRDLDHLALSFGRSSQGVDFESMDGKPVHLFFLLVAPENCAGIHLRALAKIARLLKNGTVRKKLGNVQGREEVYSVIQMEDEDF